jgi:hypothetical protein
VANRRISEFSSIPGLDIDEQDLLTLVHVFEVDPVLRNKKITFTEFKNYLDLYYPSTAGGTFSGNVLINGNLTVTGTSTFTSLTSSNLGTFSGIVVQNNAIVSGTVSGNTVTGNNVQASIFNAATGTFSTVATGTTAAFTTGAFVALTGTTTQGTSATYTNGTFTNLTGTTITGTTVNATTGNFQEIVTPSLNVANLTVSGLTVTGTAIFASGVTVTGTLSGTTVTGTTAQFTNVTGVSGVFTSQVSGAVITGDTVRSTTITGVSGTFTSSVSGATVTGNTGAFSNLTGVSGVFTQRISGDTITGNTILLSNVTGVSGVFTTQVSGATLTGNTVNATFLNAISGDFGRVSGTTITGNAGQFTSATGVSGVFTTQLSGATITGNIGQFASLTGATGTFTTSISGTTVTGDTIKGTNITGIAGVFTTSVSGSTITGNNIQGTSGVFQNISGNTITGTTISAGLVQAISGAFTNIVFINTVISGDLRVLGSGYIVSGLEVSGQISGYTVTATGGNFTSLTGTTTTGTNANFATGTFQVINATTHNVSGNLTVTGTLGVSGTATFATGVNVSGTLSGVTVTGSTAQFTTGTFISLTGTTAQGTTSTYTTGSFTSLTGTTTTGTTANFASGVFTTSVSGTTVIASTGTFTSLTGTTTQGTTATYTTGSFTSLTGTTTTGTTSSFTSGVFTTLSGATATFTSGIIASGTAAAPSLAILGDPDTGVFSPGANQLAVATNGTGRLFVDASGNVKIGSTDNSTVATTYVAIGNPGITPGGIQLWSTTAGNSYIQFGDGTSTTDQYRGYLGYVHSSDSLVFGTSTAERLRITSAGLVGVGTSSPGYKFEVDNTGGSTATARLIGNDQANVRLRIQNTGTSGRAYEIVGGLNGANNSHLSIYDATAAATRLTITETGLVGIGTSSPRVNVHIFGTASNAPTLGVASGSLIVGPGDRDYGLAMGTAVAGYSWIQSQNFVSAGAAYSLLLQPSGGNVGIGTTTVNQPLVISGTSFTAIALQTSATTGNGANDGFQIQLSGADAYLWNYENAPTIFGTNNTERARIDSSGRLLVGTSTVTGFQTGVKHIFMDGGGASYSSVSIGNPGGAADNTDINLTAWTGSGSNFYTSKIRQVGDGSLVFHTQASSSANGAGSPTERLTIASNGNILVPSGGNLGINGASPQSPLDVISNASSYGISLRGRSADNSSQLRFAANNHGSVYAALESAPTYLAAQVNGTERLRITSTGLVGIGTSSPSTPLEVAGAVGSGVISDYLSLYYPQSYGGGGSGPRMLFKANDIAGTKSTYAGIWSLLHANTVGAHSGKLVFGTTSGGNLVERLRIDESGNVGIGTSSPSTILHVASTAPYIRIQDTDSSTGVTAQGGFEMYDSDGDRLFYLANESSSSSDVSLFNNAGGALKFGTSGSERGQFDSSGRLLVGTSTNIGSQDIQVGTALGTLGLYKFANNDDGGELTLANSRNGTVGSQTIVNNNDFLGRIFFRGSDGSTFLRGADIVCQVDGTPGANDMPGRLVFSTTSDGASSPTERMRIRNDGEFLMYDVYSRTDAAGTNVVVKADGSLRRSVSSIKYKTDVETLQNSYADAILNVRPVWYRSLCEGNCPEHSWWGFIAEEVAAIDSRLVHWKTTDQVVQEDGTIAHVPCDPEPEGVAYDRFVPHLLNLIKRQGEAIADLQAEVAALKGA